PAMPRRPGNSRDSTPLGYGSAAGGRTPAATATRRGSRRSRRPEARSPPVSLPARAPRHPAARRRRRARPPRAPPHFSSRRARPAAALDSAGAPRRTAQCVHAAEERCPRASAVARPASTAPGPGQGRRLPGTSSAAARPTGATPVRLARARLVEPPAPAQCRQRSGAFDLGHAWHPVVRLGARCASGLAQPASAGGGGTREILATARPQRESAAPYDLLLLVMEVVASGG